MPDRLQSQTSRATMRNCVTLAILSVVLWAVAPSPMDQHQLELKEHYEHLAYIADFKCHTPQPRVFAVEHLFTECQTHGKAYFPDVTVLHHCGESTGCCTSGYHCVPVHSETLHLPFKVTYLEAMDKHKKGSWDIQYFDLENHTHCGCEEIPHELSMTLPKHPSHPGAEYPKGTLEVRGPTEHLSGKPHGSYGSSDKETPSVSHPSYSAGSLPVYSYENGPEPPHSPEDPHGQSEKSSTPDYKLEQYTESSSNSVQKREPSTSAQEPEDNRNSTTERNSPTTRSIEDLFSSLS